MLACVFASKGGVGKTTLAYELTAALGGVLIDLDWNSGGATGMWGFNPTLRTRAPLLDALERGPDGSPPRICHGRNLPALVPTHPDLATSRVEPGLLSDCLLAWERQWGRPWIIIDTHPGSSTLTDGALAVADWIIVPVVLATAEMRGLKDVLADLGDRDLVLVPYAVPNAPSRRHYDMLRELAADRRVSPMISEHRWLRRRLRRTAITLEPRPGHQVAKAAKEFRAVAEYLEGLDARAERTG
jgi:chromosome partitioning protein